MSSVVNLADWSNLNSWHIMTLRKNGWEELYQFDMWDWQLPGLPGSLTQFGLFGTEGQAAVKDTVVNRRMEEELRAFPGLVTKLGNGRIKVRFRNGGEEDSTVVKL